MRKETDMLKRQRKAPSTANVGDHLDRLSRIRPLGLDYDEQQNREDLDYGQTIFTRPASLLPRWLFPKSR
jgi:hypothetical protein